MQPTTTRAKQGLSTIEVLVAVILLATGVLSTLRVHGTLTAVLTRTHTRRVLATRLSSVLDSLRAIPCSAVTGGSASGPSGALTWIAVPGAGATVTVLATATPPNGGPWLTETIVPCK